MAIRKEDLISDTQLSFKLSDFLDISYEHDVSITVSSKEFRSRIQRDLPSLARYRYGKALKKTPTVVADPDYQPSQEE
ncbi:MAG: hypothetical protein Q9217_005891 [Psora testacea]